MYLYLPTEQSSKRFRICQSWDESFYALSIFSNLYWTISADGNICPVGKDLMVPAVVLGDEVISTLREAGQIEDDLSVLRDRFKRNHPLTHGLCRRISIPCGTVAEAPTGW